MVVVSLALVGTLVLGLLDPDADVAELVEGIIYVVLDEDCYWLRSGVIHIFDNLTLHLYLG